MAQATGYSYKSDQAPQRHTEWRPRFPLFTQKIARLPRSRGGVSLTAVCRPVRGNFESEFIDPNVLNLPEFQSPRVQSPHMSDNNRKYSVWPWVVALLIGLPVLYVASIGPACWVTSRLRIGESAVTFVYGPVVNFAADSNCEFAVEFIHWWSGFESTGSYFWAYYPQKAKWQWGIVL